MAFVLPSHAQKKNKLVTFFQREVCKKKKPKDVPLLGQKADGVRGRRSRVMNGTKSLLNGSTGDLWQILRASAGGRGVEG